MKKSQYFYSITDVMYPASLLNASQEDLIYVRYNRQCNKIFTSIESALDDFLQIENYDRSLDSELECSHDSKNEISFIRKTTIDGCRPLERLNEDQNLFNHKISIKIIKLNK